MKEEITIEASSKLIVQAENNNVPFTDLVSEFIDNSISSSINGNVNCSIEIVRDWDWKKYDNNSIKRSEKEHMLISDNGYGIDKDILPKALSPAELAEAKPNSLNEHGWGIQKCVGIFRY